MCINHFILITTTWVKINNVLLCDYIIVFFEPFDYLLTGPSGRGRVCTIYSPSITTNGATMNIPSGTQNVILYCINYVEGIM